VHQVRDWFSGAAAYFGWMREAKRENTASADEDLRSEVNADDGRQIQQCLLGMSSRMFI